MSTIWRRLGGAGALALGGLLVWAAWPPPAPRSLLLPEPLSALPDLGDYAWNPLAHHQLVALGLWVGLVEVLGALAWPIMAAVCRALPDRGYPLSKTLALVLLAWPVWMGASIHLVPFTVWSLLGAVALLAAGGALAWRRTGRELRAYMVAHRRLLLAWEGLFLAAFAAFLALRLVDPDLWQPIRGGEKPMDFGFLNAILRSAWMPPPDPFFAGGYINYYYYGQFLVGCLIKLVGCAPAVGYNLALPTLYGLLVVGTASVVYNAVLVAGRARAAGPLRARAAFAWGLGGAGLVCVAGNLHGGLQVISMAAPGVYNGLRAWFHAWGLTSPAMSDLFTGFQYWPVTRIAPRTIDEFPYWIFLFGELHAHLIALPFTVLVLGLVLNLLLGAWPAPPPGAEPAALVPPSPDGRRAGGVGRATVAAAWAMWGRTPGAAAGRLAVTALALGVLAVINTWDFVTYGGILGAVAGLALLGALRRGAAPGRRAAPLILGAGLGVGAVGVLALLAYGPFFAALEPLYNQVRTLLEGVNGMRRTKLAEWFVVWGLFAFILSSYLGVALRRYPWAAAWTALRAVAGRVGPPAPVAGFALSVTPRAPRPVAVAPPPAAFAARGGLLPPAVGLALLAVGGLVVLSYLTGAQWLLALLAGLLAATLAVHLCSVRAPGALFAGALFATGLATSLGVELFYIADFLQTTEWFRMNTVFKFYIQSWVLFGVAATIALYVLWGRLAPGTRRAEGAAGRLLRGAWWGAFGLLLAAAGIFVVLGTGSRLAEQFPVRPAGLTLDGTAFMDGNHFPWGPITNTVTVDLGADRAAYIWLLGHAHGWPVIATAPTAPDPEGMFVATYTGLPVVVGSLHQEEQRAPAQVFARRADMLTLFRTADRAEAGALLRRYAVTYIYLGPYERVAAADAPAGLAKFDRMVGSTLDVAYRNSAVTIYRVRP